MKRVIVACGNGVATSQSVAFRINRMLEKEGITDVRVEAVNLRSLKQEPAIDGLAFLSGENKEAEFKKLLGIIKNK